MERKLLLVLQWWEGDRRQAEKLARFLADIEPRHSNLADVLLVCRFDSKISADLTPHLSRKFNTYSYKTPRSNVGWPAGCNDLWACAMEWVYHMRVAKKTPAYKAIFTFEADGGPLIPNWIAEMSAEWDRVSREKPVVMAGPLVQVPGEHINGNALMSGDLEFLKWGVLRGNFRPRVPGGWDWVLRDTFKQMGWANIPRMRSYYNSATFTINQYLQMREEKLIWVHGIKDDSLIDMGKIWIAGTNDVPVL